MVLLLVTRCDSAGIPLQPHLLFRIHGIALGSTVLQAKTVREICPKTGSLFVRLFLGRVNVRVQQKADQVMLRDEYNKFKDRANTSEWRTMCAPHGRRAVHFALMFCRQLVMGPAIEISDTLGHINDGLRVSAMCVSDVQSSWRFRSSSWVSTGCR